MAADGSGAVDREELSPLLRELGISLAADRMREIFPHLELDSAGDVGREELTVWVAQGGMGISRTVASRLLRAGQRVRSLGSSKRCLEQQVSWL